MAEYVLMAGLIAVAAMSAAKELGPIIAAKLQSAAAALGGGGSEPAGEAPTSTAP